MFPGSLLIKSDTVEPGYLEHSTETEIRSIWRRFFTSERSLRQSKPKGNEKTFDIRYGHPLYSMFDTTEFACIYIYIYVYIHIDMKVLVYYIKYNRN